MRVSELEYSYPAELIAQFPLDERDASRMMVIDRGHGNIEHRFFRDLPDYFKPGDLLVLNDSKVFPCRLYTHKPSGGAVEVFLIREVQTFVWECLLTDSKKIPEGTRLFFSEELSGTVLEESHPTRRIRLDYEGDLSPILNEIGHIPLPRYIKRGDRPAVDGPRYQTVYAQKTGSVAAPTAGFHFTEEILQKLESKGVQVVFVTLHVGPGTFLPIRTDEVKDHSMQGEFYEIPQKCALAINGAKKEGRSVTAVGTTVVRALESAGEGGLVREGKGFTEKLIYPPYSFRIIDRLLTNFHQPRSTLLALVCAFAEREFIFNAYSEAIRKKYRLFSYGDCMMII